MPKRRAKPPFRQASQEELKRIDSAYLRFFNKLGGRQKIKPRHKFKSITLKQTGFKLLTLTCRQWDKGTWRFDKVPYTFHKHSAWHGNLRRITIKRDTCGDYWLYLITDDTDFLPLPTTVKSVGADFGMKDAYLTLSTGEKIQHPHPLKANLNKLRTLNKAVSRKVKGSGNWWRCVRQLARLYRKISNHRETAVSPYAKDFHWQLASEFCKKFS